MGFKENARTGKYVRWFRAETGWPFFEQPNLMSNRITADGVELFITNDRSHSRAFDRARGLDDRKASGVVFAAVGTDLDKAVVLVPLNSFARLLRAYIEHEVRPRADRKE